MEELIFIVRQLINDLDGSTYSDDQLLNIVCVAALFVNAETDFIDTYLVNLKDKNIDPDPTYSNVDDVPFMTLVSLKAAIIILKNECKKYALNTFRIHDGPSIIDTSSLYKSLADLLKTREEEYDQVKIDIQLSFQGGNGYTITTPTTVSNIYGRMMY